MSRAANGRPHRLFKSNGIAPWDVALGTEVVRRARERSAASAPSPCEPRYLSEDDLLRAFPGNFFRAAQVLVALDDRREVVARELAGLRREVDVAVREQDLGLGDAAG